MRKKFGHVLLIILLTAGLLNCQQESNSSVVPCNRVQTGIVIDGNLDEKEWKNAVPVELVKIISLEQPVSKTIACCLYDEQYFYVAFKCYDMDIWATYEKRDAPLYEEDVVEVFFKPDSSKDSYYEFEVSPRNIILDAFIGRRTLTGNMFFRFAKWNCSGLKSAVKIKGTLNKWDDIDQYWTVEIAIPFKSLPTVKKSPLPGDEWLFNVCRYDYSIYLENGVETLTYSPITKFDFHRYEEWKILKFQ
ncbi:MAG TPA: carbohydrate-binding family 9-like protein [bacterium]|nr:carbohydrate-binding family 9-like protein [bacterium]HOL34874.1 carbohydrate-binding family 9-like protein [bacterium]HPP07800.1 carbohydrate-binding family 9-like protein [bacterium]